ncbi:hypothetical protein QFZ34_003254 [Phyllobacterium ifriqiyense]|uniref:Lipoprotein n=1 Tax=Phyllobacterium ifriqiyense TaxID=314238 RepID=A0ABU0SBD8_9HYPH|nr:hypothetical protein [Phyllobacterium ifriqiyense]
MTGPENVGGNLKTCYLPVLLAVAGCGTYTTPAAVKLDDGTALIGTTTAAVSGGTFQLSSPNSSLTCSGNYNALDTRPTISIPVSCSDGRYGAAVVTRTPDGLGGSGYVTTSDGQRGIVAFGNNAGSILTTPTVAQATADASTTASSISSTSTAPVYGTASSKYPTSYSPVYASTSPNYSSTPSRTYASNCPTPDSYDAAGRRCGGRSAASRPGGYDGYSSWAPTFRSSYRASSGRATFVRGYYRKNGTYVRSHTRRR